MPSRVAHTHVGWLNWISLLDAYQFRVSFFSMLGLRMSFTLSVHFLIGFRNVFLPRTFDREKRLRDERDESVFTLH